MYKNLKQNCNDLLNTKSGKENKTESGKLGIRPTFTGISENIFTDNKFVDLMYAILLKDSRTPVTHTNKFI